jgi:mono/diheme cytochrome c family protein
VSRRGRSAVVLVAVTLVAAAACQPTRPASPRPVAPSTGSPVARGAVLYAGYCAGCHGSDGSGVGPVADVLRMRPSNLRDPAVLARTDRALVDALLGDAPLPTAPRWSAVAEALQVDALLAYLPSLATQNWARVRAGRFAYESTCAPCHGTYGTGEGVIGALGGPPPADLPRVRERYTGAGLDGVIRQGAGAMLAFDDLLPRSERRAIVAYVRILSPGHRTYDTYCAGCHGDDGRGVHPEDVASPALAAPPIDSAALVRLDPAARRAQVLHMFRRERGLMPHFRDILGEAQLRDVLAYLRSTS